MKVLVDTSVWSMALRRGSGGLRGEADELRALILANRVAIIGPIRQELLSGIRSEAQFRMVQNHLSAFPNLLIGSADYVTAAMFFNICRSKGIQGSNTDFLICAVASENQLAVYTTDRVFELFAKHLPITLHRAKTNA